jgi:tRNA dimethylallyltransferase
VPELSQQRQGSPGRVAIVGATASGKSDLAMRVARRCSSLEIVSVDSMCVYRGMDIGTGKPTARDRAEVSHHLLDIAEPSEEFSVARFKEMAKGAVADIERRGHLPVLVGGTALYVRAVVDDLGIPGRWPEIRSRLEAEAEAEGGTEALHARLSVLDPAGASRIDPGNGRRLVRALEVTLGSGRPFSSFGPGLAAHPPTPYRLVGLDVPLAVLDRRIGERFMAQLRRGLLEEVRSLSRLELSRTARQALGYRELLAFVAGEIELKEAVSRAVSGIRRLARRQLSWLRRDPRITWTDPESACEAILEGRATCQR